MKKMLFVLFLLIFSANIFAENIKDNEEENNFNNEIKIYDLSGFILELSFFNYFNIGLGYNLGKNKVAAGHFFGYNYGFFIEYKTVNELHFRIFYDICGGSSGTVLGASGIVATNFNSVTAGLAPHIGAGFPQFKIFYRYNFYLDKTFNCHEIIIFISSKISQ
jgi:hypothetical protein